MPGSVAMEEGDPRQIAYYGKGTSSSSAVNGQDVVRFGPDDGAYGPLCDSLATAVSDAPRPRKTLAESALTFIWRDDHAQGGIHFRYSS